MGLAEWIIDDVHVLCSLISRNMANRVPIKMGEFSVVDTEFDSIRERFDNEMRKMEEEMNKFRSDLLNNESRVFSKSAR